MKVLFLFMSQGAASPGMTTRTYPIRQCGSRYMESFSSEGYFKMLQVLLENKIISDLKIFFESNVQPGIASWVKNAYCEVIPEIRFVEEYIEEDTVIFVRGGFKHWHDLLVKYKGKNWLLIYAANTGRERWSWWDIIFDDLRCRNVVDDHGRYYFPFIKPINEEVFYPQNGEIKWDFCIGASHVHDRKGQWRVVDAIEEYNKRYGMLRAVMPGAPRRGLKTVEMIRKIPRVNRVEMLGHVDRETLRGVFNSSKYFIHLGAHGQNDRGPIESIACGTPIIIGSPDYHASYLSNIYYTGCNINDPVSVAESLKILLESWTPLEKQKVIDFYRHESGFNEVIIPRMSLLFDLLKSLKPNLKSKFIIKRTFKEIESR